MGKILRAGMIFPVIGLLLNLMVMVVMAGDSIPLSKFESVGTVNFIAPYSGYLTIDGKSYRLAKGVRMFGLETTQGDARSALSSIRGRNIGYILGSGHESNVVTAILVFP